MQKIANAPIDLRDRTLAFAKDVIKFTRNLQRDSVNQSIIVQLVRSSSSIGANFTEAKDSGSRKDFRNKVFIAKKEASETLYWLKLCSEFTESKQAVQLQDECKQIILILQKIVSTLDH